MKDKQGIDAILVGDMHLMDRNPECRSDDYLATTISKLIWLSNLQKKHNVPVICAGDVFDRSNSSLFLVGKAMERLPDKFYYVAGQHDLPQHSMKLYDKSALSILSKTTGRILLTKRPRIMLGCAPEGTRAVKTELYGYSWADTVDKLEYQNPGRRVAVRHRMVWDKEIPYPGCTAGNAHSLLAEMEDFDLVVTGDNHQAFVVEEEGRLLVNPGSFMRMRADQMDFKPRVYLWNAENNIVVPEYVPIEEGVMTRKHIEVVKERDERIEKFVNKLSNQSEIGLSFTDNIKKFFETNEIKPSVKDWVWKAIES